MKSIALIFVFIIVLIGLVYTKPINVKDDDLFANDVGGIRSNKKIFADTTHATNNSIDTSLTYQIAIQNGRTGCNNFLSTATCGSNLVDLFAYDDGSGRQRWKFTPVLGKINVYNVQAAGGRVGCNNMLSVGSCGTNLVDMYSGDDGSGRQQWWANPIYGTSNTFNFLVSAGRPGCNNILSSASCSDSDPNLVDLFYTDDASGRQQWVLTPVS